MGNTLEERATSKEWVMTAASALPTAGRHGHVIIYIGVMRDGEKDKSLDCEAGARWA
jgi:hypothetical protein